MPQSRGLSPESATIPYGPVEGTVKALDLLQRLSPSRVDEAFLRSHNMARGNEYKVVGALRYLGLIDEECQVTERGRLLKTRGPTYVLALQDILRRAYGGLFARLNPKEASQEAIYNYFVTEAGLGAAMATKATRLFVAMCRRADLGSPQAASKRTGRQEPAAPQRQRTSSARSVVPSSLSPAMPLVLAITPQLAEMSEEELTKLLRKVRNAWRRAGEA